MCLRFHNHQLTTDCSDKGYHGRGATANLAMVNQVGEAGFSGEREKVISVYLVFASQLMIAMCEMARIALDTIFVLNEVFAQLSFIEVVQLVWPRWLWLGACHPWGCRRRLSKASAVRGRIKFKLGQVLGHSTLEEEVKSL